MRRSEFEFFGATGTVPISRHRARSLNQTGPSIFTYENPGQHWWGYA
jgi:hypothetical protein